MITARKSSSRPPEAVGSAWGSIQFSDNQGCGSAFIFCGFGSSCFLNADTDPALKNYLMKSLLKLKKPKQRRLLKSIKKTLDLVQSYSKNFNIIIIITNFLAFFCYYFLFFPSWIRIQEGNFKADPYPQPW